MTKKNKVTKGIVCGLFAAAVAAVIVLGVVYGGFIPVSKDEVVASFEENDAVMQSIVETLSAYEKSTLVLSSESDSLEMYNEFFADFEDGTDDERYVTLCTSINSLFENEGYTVIIKKDNYILFSKQESYDYSKGVAYSTDGKTPEIEGATEIHVLSQENWYYWESEYDLADKIFYKTKIVSE